MQREAVANATIISTDSTLIAHVTAMLSAEGMRVQVQRCAEPGAHALATLTVDVVIIDDRTAGIAPDAVKCIRRHLPQGQIVCVYVEDERRCVSLLENGADDAVLLTSALLSARLRVASRRFRALNQVSRTAMGDIVFDRRARRVSCAGRDIALTPHELGVLECLFAYAPRPVDTDTLWKFVWGEHLQRNKRALVQAYVSYVRKKLVTSELVTIQFARGAGYRLTSRLVEAAHENGGPH